MASGGLDEQALREVVAMQFAGGMAIARLAEDWQRDSGWVEEAIRQALLETIPERYGGLKVSKTEARAVVSEKIAAVRGAQSLLFTSSCDARE